MPELHAEENKVCSIVILSPDLNLDLQEAAPVDTAAEQCAEIIKAKETCLSEVSYRRVIPLTLADSLSTRFIM